MQLGRTPTRAEVRAKFFERFGIEVKNDRRIPSARVWYPRKYRLRTFRGVRQVLPHRHVYRESRHRGALYPAGLGLHHLGSFEEPTSEEEAIETICELYEQPAEVIAPQIEDFIPEPLSKNLLETLGPLCSSKAVST